MSPWVALGAVGLVYALSVVSFPWPGDSAELTTAAATLGVAHPTGYPLYVVLGHLAIRLLPFLAPALVMNALSAVYMLAALALLIGVLRRLEVAPSVSAASVLVLGTTRALWENASWAEVYALHVLLSAILVDAVLRAEGDKRWWRPLLPWLIAGLSMANHMTSVLYFPGLLVWQLGRRAGGSGREVIFGLLRAAAAAALGASCILVLLVLDRPDALNYIEQYAREFPRKEFADPVQRFIWISTGGHYGAGAENLKALLSSGVVMQALRYVGQILNHAPVLVLGGVLGLLLAGFAPKRFRTPAAALRFVLITVVLITVYLVGYSGSFSEYAFFTVGYTYLGLGLAIAADRGLQTRRLRVLVVCALVATAVFSVITHRQLLLRGDGAVYAAGDRDFLASIEADAVVLSTWGNSSLFWYAQWVDGVNAEVLVLNARPGSWPRLMHQFSDRPIYVENIPYHLDPSLFSAHHHFFRLRGY